MGQKTINFDTKFGIRCSTKQFLRFNEIIEYTKEDKSSLVRRLLDEEYRRIFLPKKVKNR